MLQVKRLDPEAILPISNEGDAGYDIYSNEEVTIMPGRVATVKTGIACNFPEGYVARLCDRSGIAVGLGLHVVAGVIDQTYRGEWMVAFHNTSKVPKVLAAYTRIAQALFYKVADFLVVPVKELDETKRGDGGFGSTGVK
jgi:deoxyuridine 5'-triphosphate nucleotidohydrolase